jgi:putative endonuclease
MTSKMQTGSDGEGVAAEYLLKKGYQVVERNYKYRHLEVDLIVRKENWLVFVEVKTRSKSDFGFPEEFVDKSKQRNILMAAEHYIYETDWRFNVRYDIISVLRGTVTHFEDAFY